MIQRSSHTAAKALGSTLDFPTWGSGKGTGSPKESDFESQWDLMTELPQYQGKEALGGPNKTLGVPGARERSITSEQMSWTCLCGGVGQGRPALRSRALAATVVGGRGVLP